MLAPPSAPARTVSRSGKAGSVAPVGAVQPETPYGPGVESPHPGPTGGEDEWEEPPLEKGQYLRVFSGLRNGA